MREEGWDTWEREQEHMVGWGERFGTVQVEESSQEWVQKGKTKAANKKVPVSNSTITKSLVANKMKPNNSWGSSSSNVPSSLIDCRLSKSSSDTWTPIMGYGDYQIGNVIISWMYYVEGLGHNLFSVGQFCDSDLEVAFRQHTCFIRNLDGVDLLTGSRGN
nr:integrase, catalytic region, zinc finger, CCHC-type, peptidase aspartic, catalytic [Tanacetum cinerariifolium]